MVKSWKFDVKMVIIHWNLMHWWTSLDPYLDVWGSQRTGEAFCFVQLHPPAPEPVSNDAVDFLTSFPAQRTSCDKCSTNNECRKQRSYLCSKCGDDALTFSDFSSGGGSLKALDLSSSPGHHVHTVHRTQGPKATFGEEVAAEEYPASLGR